MKCKNNILIAHYTGAGYSQILGSVDTVSHQKSPSINGYYEERICGGKIKVDLHIPYYIHNPTIDDIDMEFSCSECGKSYPEIAQGYNLSGILEEFNKVLESME